MGCGQVYWDICQSSIFQKSKVLLKLSKAFKLQNFRLLCWFTLMNHISAYGTLPAQVYISGTSIKKIKFWWFVQLIWILKFFYLFIYFYQTIWGLGGLWKYVLYHQGFKKRQNIYQKTSFYPQVNLGLKNVFCLCCGWKVIFI